MVLKTGMNLSAGYVQKQEVLKNMLIFSREHSIDSFAPVFPGTWTYE
jgi:hypothetical protein